MEIRQRRVITEPTFNRRIEKIDIFHKIPTECKVASKTGITLSILYIIFVIFIIIIEISDFLNPKINFNYSIDDEFAEKISISFDLTVKMKCNLVNMDLMDAQIDSNSTKSIRKYPVMFELEPNARKFFDIQKAFLNNSRYRYHSIQNRIWSSVMREKQLLHPFSLIIDENDPFEKEVDSKIADACRLKGVYRVSRAKGNMHILPGVSIDLPGFPHFHLVDSNSDNNKNYSHRIHHFFFGTPLESQIHPLQAEEFIAAEKNHLVKYFIQIVPTRYKSFSWSSRDAYQYSLTVHNPSKAGSNDDSGIVISFDFYPVRILVEEDYKNILSWMLRIISAVGGLYAVLQAIEFLILSVLNFRDNLINNRIAKNNLSPELLPEGEN